MCQGQGRSMGQPYGGGSFAPGGASARGMANAVPYGPKPMNMGMQRPISDPYRDYGMGAQPPGMRPPMTSDMFGSNGMKPHYQQPSQRQQTGGINTFNEAPISASPGGWQPSYGGAAPQPFMPSPQTGGLNTFNQAPVSAPQAPASAPQAPIPAPQAPPQPTGDVVADQRAMDAYNQQQFTKSGAAPQTRQPPPPQPSQMQPGQAGWNWGVNPVAGNVRTDFGQSWQPAWSPGQNEYLNRMTVGANGVAPWLGQVDWNNAIQSVGQLSGTPFNPAMWSR